MSSEFDRSAQIEVIAIGLYESKVRALGPDSAKYWPSWEGQVPLERARWRQQAKRMILESRDQKI
ncbi:hypothetical protein D869_gp026 [Caulobacter phage CcrRogue]|uniref:Uncharacterized protein n=1 Tax=Caulobacter phage CcrRogue TaxID=2927986 RepID=K4JS05_9CAUD|nr:hypothetical protein D869_gp026 [Caulobacter phage CcrRogue]AFU86508.1 hypothetical protein CcrRogue_gp026 [Caulobacter phage CcrRogue]